MAHSDSLEGTQYAAIIANMLYFGVLILGYDVCLYK